MMSKTTRISMVIQFSKGVPDPPPDGQSLLGKSSVAMPNTG